MIKDETIYRGMIRLIKVRKALEEVEPTPSEDEIQLGNDLVNLYLDNTRNDMSIESVSNLNRLCSIFVDTVMHANRPDLFVEEVGFAGETISDTFLQKFESALVVSDFEKKNPLKLRDRVFFDVRLEVDKHILDKQLLQKTFALTNAKNNAELQKALREYVDFTAVIEAKLLNVKDESITEEINIANTEDVTTIFEKVIDIENGVVSQTGFQGINQMLQGGFKRGESIGIVADSHNYKSGLTLTMFISMLLDNDAPEVAEGKKSAVAWYSLEDPLTHVFDMMFNYTYHYVEGKAPEVSLSAIKKAEYVKEKLLKKGWHILFFKADPTKCNWDGPMNAIKKKMSKGYEFSIIGFDYLPLLSTKGLEGSGGTELRQLIRNYRNFCQNNNITMFSPLQASPGVNSLASEGILKEDRVKVMARRNMTAMSKQLVQDFDIMMYIDKVIHEGIPLLLIVLRKHKHPKVIAEHRKFVILRFMLDRPIIGDLGKEPEYWHKLSDVPLDNEDLQEDANNPF